MTRQLLQSVAVLLFVAALAGCGNVTKYKETAADAMDEFHDRFNAGSFDKIYDTADADFQAVTTRADFLKLLESIHRKLGDYKTCESQGWNASTFNSDARVTLHYTTKFTKGAGNEEFLYRISGTRATLLGYHINSNQLITD